MTTREYVEWRAFERLEPFGDAAANWRSAMLAQLTANIARNPKKQKAFTLRDWLPQTSLTIKEARDDLSSRLLGAFRARPKDDDRKGR